MTWRRWWVVADPAADITDVYAWVEGGKLVMVLNVHPDPGPADEFSDALQYALHVVSAQGYGLLGVQTDIICSFDGFDAVCGNQLAATDGKNDPSRYVALAGMFADDRLYIDADEDGCDTYLAVELAALGLMIQDCGGRRLPFDVVDSTDSALVSGTILGVGDGVPIGPSATGTMFPYLAPPL